MKNKIVTIILGVVLIVSVVFNIYLFSNMAKSKDEIAALSSQVVTADEQIEDLQKQAADLDKLQEQLSDLQEQLAESNEQIKTLENALAEKDAQIEADKALAEQVQRENEAREKGETIAQPTIPKEEYTDFVIPEGFGGPGEIGPGSPGWMGSGANLGEGSSTIDTSGLIVH